MSAIPITRIPWDDPALRSVLTEQLREYVAQRFRDKYDEQHPGLLVNVWVSRRSDYNEVMVFLSDMELVADAEEFALSLEQELSAEGISALIYVRTWTGPWQGGEATPGAPRP